ncbi:MAG: acetate kinase [Oscillospiraceae bacterium]|jgi:acetate kinase|nr:acetate kinase [Oscillospiraceae bacterium]
MKVLVINAGSSSLKYQLIDMDNEAILAKGNCERIGIDKSSITHNANGKKYVTETPISNHTEAFMMVKDALTKGEGAVIADLSEISAIGHRVVQGGALFKQSVIVDKSVVDGIESLNPLAPLHNPAHIQGINAALDVFGKDVPEVVVFDTAFHSTMPEEAYIFAVPYEFYEKYQIRRYGFHGTSHRYVTARCLELLGRSGNPEGTKIISCHLGNGSSITAVKDGKVIDTSMGLTPLDGFMMGTRSGSLDPSVVTYIAEKEGLTPSEMDNLLNKKSGMLGISGVSSDDRDIGAAAEAGNERAILAHKMLEYQIKKFVGGYAASLNGCDAIIFTAGIGENQTAHREAVCEGLSYLGVKLDKEKNAAAKGIEMEISTPDSQVKVYVIPTNEEIVIARDTKKLVEELAK